MEGDRRQAAVGRQQLPGRGQRLFELRQLVVDGDPQRLEGPLGGVTAGELGGDRNGGLDRVDELLRGRELLALPGAHDRAGDLRREALLAVLAQEPGQSPLVPRVDDLLGGQRLLGIHPHVQRGVVGVGEAALPRVDLHRGHPQVEVDDVGVELLVGEVGEGGHEVGADEARMARHLGGERGEALLGGRIAVDADQRSRGPESLGEQARMPTAADGAVDARPRPGEDRATSISSPARTGMCVLVMSSSVAKARCEFGDPGQDFLEVLRVALAIPDLQALA